MKVWLGLSLVVSTALGCSSGGGTHEVIPTDGNNPGNTGGTTPTTFPAPYTGLTWTVSDVKVATPTAAAGYQAKLLRGADGTLYYAYYRVAPVTANTCNIAAFSSSDPAPGINYYLDVAVKAPGASAWTIETLHLDRLSAAVPYVTNRYGLDGTIDGQGRPVLVFAGGGPGTFNCGSSDLIMAVRSGAGTDPWVLTTLAVDSSGCCAVPDCSAEAACTQGDVVGPWAAAATDGDGNVVTSFMDYHFNTDHDGWNSRGLELWSGGAITGIEPWSGRGTYAQLRYLAPKTGSTFSGLLAVYSSITGTGLFVTRRTGTSGHITDWEKPAGATTMRDLTSGGQLGERPSVAIAPDGTVGIAFYLMRDTNGQTQENLVYCYSSDNGDHWVVPCQNVDTINTVGEYPSLAYDKQSRPMISYYYCGSGGVCKADSDALRLAWRDAATAKWLRYNVHVDASTIAGLYTQLTVDPTTDEPVIVFQDATRGAAMAARGTLTGGN